MNIPEYRLAKQAAYCRVCDRALLKGIDYMVSWYSHRNRGQNIHICPECVKTLNMLIPDKEEKEGIFVYGDTPYKFYLNEHGEMEGSDKDGNIMFKFGNKE